METEFRKALARSEFELHYQPIVDVVSGEIVSLEALLRWKHPERGYIPPLEFIPMAEENGLIVPLGWWVLEEACRQLEAFQARFPRPVPLSMSVNISAKQFSQADLSQKLEALLSQSKIVPGTLELELTESVIMERGEAATSRLEEFKALGLRLFIDDFGTGYSSLSYLHRFPIDMLQDRPFLHQRDRRHGRACGDRTRHRGAWAEPRDGAHSRRCGNRGPTGGDTDIGMSARSGIFLLQTMLGRGYRGLHSQADGGVGLEFRAPRGLEMQKPPDVSRPGAFAWALEILGSRDGMAPWSRASGKTLAAQGGQAAAGLGFQLPDDAAQLVGLSQKPL